MATWPIWPSSSAATPTPAPTEASIKQFAKVKAEVDGYAERWSKIKTEDAPKLKLLIVRDPTVSSGGSQ